MARGHGGKHAPRGGPIARGRRGHQARVGAPQPAPCEAGVGARGASSRSCTQSGRRAAQPAARGVEAGHGRRGRGRCCWLISVGGATRATPPTDTVTCACGRGVVTCSHTQERKNSGSCLYFCHLTLAWSSNLKDSLEALPCLRASTLHVLRPTRHACLLPPTCVFSCLVLVMATLLKLTGT